MLIKSKAVKLNRVELPLYTGEVSMVRFDLETLAGLPSEFIKIAKEMLKNIKATGYGFFTIHGQVLKSGDTLRRPGPHVDGNYEPCSWDRGGGNGWKVNENGPSIDTDYHRDSYLKEEGGIILVSNYSSCLGWVGDFNGIIGVGGDCSKVNLNSESFMLDEDVVYYGNNHFIHESLPVDKDVHRVLARITLPMTHSFMEDVGD